MRLDMTCGGVLHSLQHARSQDYEYRCKRNFVLLLLIKM